MSGYYISKECSSVKAKYLTFTLNMLRANERRIHCTHRTPKNLTPVDIQSLKSTPYTKSTASVLILQLCIISQHKIFNYSRLHVTHRINNSQRELVRILVRTEPVPQSSVTRAGGWLEWFLRVFSRHAPGDAMQAACIDAAMFADQTDFITRWTRAVCWRKILDDRKAWALCSTKGRPVYFHSIGGCMCVCRR